MTVDVKALRELLSVATPRPWRECKESPELGTIGTPVLRMYDEPDYIVGQIGDWGEGGAARDDAALVMAAVNALPELLDELEAARAAIVSLNDWLNRRQLGSKRKR